VTKTRKKWLLFSVRVLAIAAIGFGLWYFIQGLDWDALADAFRTATLWPLAIAAVLNFVCLFGKAACWRIMLAPRFNVPVSRLTRYTIAAFAASAIAPARAGEVLRVWVLKRREGVPAADTTAVALSEKLLDVITMLLICAPMPWLVDGLPAWVGGSMAACAGVAVGIFIGLYVAVGRIDATKAGSSWLRRLVAGMHVLRSPKRLFASLVVLMLVWAADLGMVLLVAHSVDIAISAAEGLLVLFTLNLLIAVPSTPAQVGALEVGALAALRILHVSEAPALAFALLYHVVQVVPLICVGLLLELRLVLGREPAMAEAIAKRDADVATTVEAAQPANVVDLASRRVS
jgi:hypothetical protein